MLTAAQALAQLKGMVAWQIEPRLNEDELTTLLRAAAVLDDAGLRPDDEGWTPTYSPVFLNAAAADGWMWKAARLTADKSGVKGDNSFSPEAQRRDMMDMAKDYRRRLSGSQRMQPFPQLSDKISGALLN